MPETMKMTVNVSLCGSIPRSQMNFSSMKMNLREIDLNFTDSSSNDVRRNGCKTPCLKLTTCGNVPSVGLPRKVSCEEIATSSASAQSPPPIIEPPAWAVAAEGEARLEPVCESFNLQSPIDLTKQAVFRIGRSQNSDVQLLHCTSSRRHAILFHHPNGSCYIVDCGSAHGTYVNDVRVNSTDMHPQNQNNGSSGTIMPHKVRKGSLIRFGGPGAPAFILKSFDIGLETLVEDLEEANKISICQKVHDLDSFPETCDTEDDESYKASEALVTLNTRLNAIGSCSLKSLSSKNLSSSLSSAHIHARLQPQTSTISFLKKRSIVSFDDDHGTEMPPLKKSKFMTPNAFDQLPSLGVAIVSPSRQKPILQFNFESIDRPVVSPTPVEDVETLNVRDSINMSESNSKSILRTPLSLPSTKRNNRRVNFSDTPKVFHPCKISTDESD